MIRVRRRIATGAAILIAVGAVAMGGAACGGGGDDDDSADTTTEAPATTAPATTAAETVTEAAGGDVAAGQMVFNQTCTTCHAENGEGQGPVGPNLAGEGLSQAEIEDVVENGRGAMPGGLVSGEQFDDVVAYLDSIQ